jgi:hypothetical protein
MPYMHECEPLIDEWLVRIRMMLLSSERRQQLA